MNKLTQFIIAILAQLGILLFLILANYSIFAGGTSIILKVHPVDPTDPFRGDYVTFQYDISSIEAHTALPTQEIHEGDTVYIPLRNQGDFWNDAYGITKTIPHEYDSNILYIKGVVQNAYSGSFVIKYGIEDYFIPEGTGRTGIFNSNNDVKAVVSVDSKGNAVLKSLLVNDKIWP